MQSNASISHFLFVNRDKIVVFVGTVTDDIRLLDVPKVTVAALKFTETARARVTKAGGKCMTLDELVMQAPTGMCSQIYFLFALY